MKATIIAGLVACAVVLGVCVAALFGNNICRIFCSIYGIEMTGWLSYAFVREWRFIKRRNNN